MEQERAISNLRDFLLVLFKNKYKILTVFMFCIIAASIKIYLITPLYQANSSLMVRLGEEHIYRPEAGQGEKVMLSLSHVLKTEIQILKSRDLIERVITDLGVENIYPDMVKPSPKGPTPVKELTKRATGRFNGQLGASAVNGSNVINVSFKHEDPQVAARAVNQLIEFFKVRHIEIFRNPRSSFLESQVTLYRERLQKSEEDLAAFKQKNRVFSLGQQRNLLLDQQNSFDISLKNAQRNIHTLQQKISYITSRMQTTPEYKFVSTSTGKSKNIHDAQNKMLNLQIREQELLSKYDESNRKITNTRKEIQLVKDFLVKAELNQTSEGTSVGVNSLYRSMESQLYAAQTELSAQETTIAAIEQQLKQLNGEIQDLDAQEKELRSLNRELAINEKSFKTYLEKLEEARIEDELDSMKKVNIAVIQKATVPLRPLPSKKKKFITVGIILGAASGLFLALFSEYYVEQGITTPEGVEKRLGLPVLVTIPYKKQKKSRV